MHDLLGIAVSVIVALISLAFAPWTLPWLITLILAGVVAAAVIVGFVWKHFTKDRLPKRDVSLREAIHYLTLGTWKGDWAAVNVREAGDHLALIEKRFGQVRQAARDGDLPIWGQLPDTILSYLRLPPTTGSFPILTKSRCSPMSRRIFTVIPAPGSIDS